jgi:hypothetical protein
MGVPLNRNPTQGDNANRAAMKSNSLLYTMKGSPAPPVGSGLSTLKPMQGDTLQVSLKKIDAILYVAGGP